MPEATRKPVNDFYLLAIQLKESIPEGWCPMVYTALDDREGTALIQGSVAPLKTRGPSKGRPNWRKRDLSTERKFVVTRAQIQEAKAHFEARTGLCYECDGNGTKFSRWERDIGSTYDTPCKRCSQTGIAPHARPGG
jgi:hypothetical protein